jgi:hypothetical protein
MALSDPPRTSSTLRAAIEVREGGDTAALLLALAGDEEDARHLVLRALEAPRRGLLLAVGWAGAVSAIPPLIVVQAEATQAFRPIAARAGGAPKRWSQTRKG